MFKIHAPAKINWSLNVLKKRDDSYHNIISLMHCIKLFDELTFESSDKIEILSDLNIPLEQNLIYKALSLLKELYSVNKGARIILKKTIPTGAGLGGGSSDAAYTLLGLNRLWNLSLNRKELTEIALKIGSDVPFFLHCPLCIVEGKGDIIHPLDIHISYPLLLVKPSIDISTSWAYKILAESRSFQKQHLEIEAFNNELTKYKDYRDNIKLIHKALLQKNIVQLKNLLKNDFEPIITTHFAVIGDIKERLLKAGASIAMMSGSGSTVFGVFKDTQEALKASKEFHSFWHQVVETLF